MKIVEANVIICDIEGTTTSISFVKDVLFPFSKQHVQSFLSQNADDFEVKLIFKELQHLPEYTGMYYETIDNLSIPQITKLVISLVDNDKKVSPLKSLQGLIWKQGYDKDLLKGHVYLDVQKAFKKWTQNQIKIFIYSSGSVQAQKLLFQNTIEGDLLPYISGHFDTRIGHKQEQKSYENILKEIGVTSDKVVFFTDIVKEAEAAASIEINTILLDRPGNAAFTDENKKSFAVIKSFDEVEIKKIK